MEVKEFKVTRSWPGNPTPPCLPFFLGGSLGFFSRFTTVPPGFVGTVLLPGGVSVPPGLQHGANAS